MNTEKNMLDALIQHQVYTYRASTKVVNELNDLFIKSTNSFTSKLRDLIDDLTDPEKEALVLGKYTTDTLKEVKVTFDDWYRSMLFVLPETFAVSAVALAVYESTYMSKLYGKELELDGEKIVNQAKKMPIVGGQLFDDVWKNLSDSTRNKALYAVREGINNGLTTAEMVSEIKGRRVKQLDGTYEYVGGIVEQTKNHIESATRTIRSHVSQIAYQRTFEALALHYIKDVATLDGRTSATCRARDGLVQRDDETASRPPYHFNCRTVQIGCEKDGKIDGLRPFVADTRSVKDIPKDERKDIIGQVDANTTYPQWFARQDVAFQKEVLGKTKYELYKNGGMKLDKFVDKLGIPYTIQELRGLDEDTFKRLGL